MATKTISWPNGTGSITATYDGSGNGTIVIASDPNNLSVARSAQISVKTTDGSNITRTVTINQAAKAKTDLSTADVYAAAQTYDGTAQTPTVHVVLNGGIVDASGYDVAYSNNINAGTANITVTGKGDYEGTAYGTFTINQATGQVTTVPTARSVTYNGNTQYLVTAGSGTGTMYYRYKLSTSSTWSSWSSTRARATDAGTYDVQYVAYASSDGNYTTSAVGSLSVTMAKASRTLSFADTYAVVAPSGTVTKTATPSAGSGDGAITYTISSTTYATINASTGAVTAKTSEGSAVVTATIAEGDNYLSATASYNLYVFATTHNFAYTGDVQNIALPPGSYKLQCWGAQGGSNAADSTYGITAKAGGKGGYAEGVLTIAAQTTLYAFVGGQGASSGNGGWNCGGGTSGSTEYTSGNNFYITKMACGGGATDFALVTSSMSYSSRRNNRSDASLLSRMIVAGGGSGGAMACNRSVATYDTNVTNLALVTGSITSGGSWSVSSSSNKSSWVDVSAYRGWTCTFTASASHTSYYSFIAQNIPTVAGAITYATGYSGRVSKSANTVDTVTIPSDATYMWIYRTSSSGDITPQSVVFTNNTDTTTACSGYAGGGVNGDGRVTGTNDYRGRQDSAGDGVGSPAFGKGANQPASSLGVASGAGGAGWYGGGANNANTSVTYIQSSGGGSGFVNTSANAQYRPTGYTGLELDSGSTTAGSSSFPSTNGGTETGHSGNGYAKITRL